MQRYEGDDSALDALIRAKFQKLMRWCRWLIGRSELVR